MTRRAERGRRACARDADNRDFPARFAGDARAGGARVCGGRASAREDARDRGRVGKKLFVRTDDVARRTNRSPRFSGRRDSSTFARPV